MTRTHEKVGDLPEGRFRTYTPESAAAKVSEALKVIEGRWKMVILFHLFDKGTLRFSHFEKLIPGVSQKMLGQQLRDLEEDGVVTRTVFPEVPPRVEYSLTDHGKALCPAINGLIHWAESSP